MTGAELMLDGGKTGGERPRWELKLIALRVSFSSIGKCEFSGISHNNISMGDSAKVACSKS